MDKIEVSTDPLRLDVELIHRFLSGESYWSKGISMSKVEQSIANSLNFGVYEGSRQVGFARVISDFTTIAYLGDVFIVDEYRGRGLGKLLMKEVKSHPTLQGLRRWFLLTKDAHGLYEQFGFTSITQPEKWMEAHTANLYVDTN